MEEMEVTKEIQNSVKLTINAKGQYAGELKVYAYTIDEAFSVAIAKAIELENLIKQKNRGNANE